MRHGVRLSRDTFADAAPILGTRQRRIAGSGGLEVGQLRRQQRQIEIVQPCVAALVPDDRKRLTPVSLSTEQPVAQLVVDRPLAKRLLLEPGGDPALGLRCRHAIEKAGIHRSADPSEAKRLFALRRLHHHLDRQLEFLGKLQVTRVVRRHSHDGASAVTGQHVVGRPDRHRAAVGRIHRVGTGKHPGFVLGQVGPLEVAFPRRLCLIRLDFRFLFRRNDCVQQIALWRKHHVRRAEQRVWTRGKNRDLRIGILDLENDLRALGSADPVALHFLERIAPLDAVEIVQQTLGVGGDAQHPLPHRLAFDRETAHLADAVLDLLVGKHRAQLGAPVHRRLGHVGQTMFVAPSALLLFRRGVVGISQRLDRLRPVRLGIEPRVVQLQENPLRPAEVLRVGRVDLPTPVVAETKRLNLPFEVADVGLGGDARMLTGLDRVLLGRQAERIPADRVQHVEPLHALVAREDVRRRVALRMTDVQPRPGRVREHVEDVVLWQVRRVSALMAFAEWMTGGGTFAGVPCAERFATLPVFLPLRLE